MFNLHLDPLKDLREFFNHQSEALQNASVLLGGQPALRCTQALMDDLEIQPRMTHRMERNLVRLREVLTLKYAYDPERVEATCFADIDPVSPIVEEIWLLSDEFEDHLLSCFSLNRDAANALVPA